MCALLAALGLAAGCSQAPRIPTLAPYKMDIQQGNFVTQEMLAKLKPGMTPSQVRFILGTPLVVDAFHKDRWDYVYRFSKAGKLQETRRIVVVFKDDRLASIEGDVVAAVPGSATTGGVPVEKPRPDKEPAGAAGAPAGTTGSDAGKKPAEGKPQEEQGFFGRMLERMGF